MYQGCSDNFLGACATMPLPDEAYGIDLEGELAVITSAVPMGTTAAAANQCIRLLALVNDVSLRNLLFAEMSTGFGMIHCKPTSVFSPVCVTPDELDALKPGHFEMTMHVQVNGQTLGRLRSDEMEFPFGDLISHAARTRFLAAGTIIGSGTFSNADESRGCGCLAEKRALEQMNLGAIETGWLRFRDRVRIEAFDSRGASIFGAIQHTFEQAETPLPAAS
jgi:fumarylacetoacetate (FAA) hydrolase